MIRINLLQARPQSADRLGGLLSAGASSTFISGREATLGAAFLLLTVVILGVFVSQFSASEAEDSPPIAALEQPALQPTPEPVDVISDPEPVAVISDPEPEPKPKPAPIQAASAPRPAVTPPRPAPAPRPVQPVRREPSPPAAAAMADARAPGTPLTAVRVTPLSDRVDIFLEMPNPAPVTGFDVGNPPRIVFDIPGASLQIADSLRNRAVDSPIVRRLRIAQYTFDPPVVRLVLEVGANPSAQASATPVGLSIHVSPSQ